MRALGAVVVLAGCRLHFDDVARVDAAASLDDAGVDAAPLALACNTPVSLSTSAAGNPHLTAAVSGNVFVAFWLDDQGRVATQGGTLVAADAVQPAAPTLNPMSACSMVAIAVTGTTLLGACGSVDMSSSGGTLLQPFDIPTGTLMGAATTSPIRIASPRGLTAIDAAFVIGGVGYNPGVESDVARLSLAGVSTAPRAQVVAGTTNARVAAQPNGSAVVVAFGPTTACTVRLYTSGSLGPAATWGNTGMCQEPIAIPSTSNSKILLVRKDTADGDLNHQVATVSGGVLSLPGEGKLSGVADEARGIALGTGYWVGFHDDAGMLEAIAVDATGGTGTPHTLGPMASLDAHDLFTIGGEPYAVWFSNGLQIAHLCP